MTGSTAPTIYGEKQKASERANIKFLSVAFLSCVDKARYGKMLEEIENDYTKGTLSLQCCQCIQPRGGLK
jgi:hypothetical protein